MTDEEGSKVEGTDIRVWVQQVKRKKPEEGCRYGEEVLISISGSEE